MVLRQQQRGDEAPFSWPNLQDVQRDNHSFEAIGSYHNDAYTVTGHGVAEQVQGSAVNSDYFRVMRIVPLLGRTINATDDQPTAPRVVVLRESLWRRKFGGREDVLGQAIAINGQSYVIIGVMPNALMNPSGGEFWMPIAPFADNDDWRNRRNEPGLFAFARLRAGVRLEQARADLLTIGQRLQHDFPADDSGILPVTAPAAWMRSRGPYRESLTMLMGAVGLLLVIACANVASLQLMRGFNRAHEFSIRAALGAGRAPLVRLLLAESFVLGALGGGLGLLLAFWSVDGIRLLSPATPRFQALAVDRVVLGFSLVLSPRDGNSLRPVARVAGVARRPARLAPRRRPEGSASAAARNSRARRWWRSRWR